MGIDVPAICPGCIDTDINHELRQTESGRKLMEALPRKHVGELKD